jgi:hypothetical protein
VTIIQLAPWTRQPQYPAQVNLDPAPGLLVKSLILPSVGPVDLVLPSRSITQNANCSRVISDDGFAYSSSDGNSGLIFSGGFGNFVSTSNSITVMGRVYVTALGSRRVIVADWNAAGAGNSIAVEAQAANSWRCLRYDGAANVTGGTVTIGWHTFVNSIDPAGGGQLWVDGVSLGTMLPATARPSGTTAAWLDSGAFVGGIGWNTNKASLMIVAEGFANTAIAKAFHDNPWGFSFAPQTRRIWAPAAAAGTTDGYISSIGAATGTAVGASIAAAAANAAGTATGEMVGAEAGAAVTGDASSAGTATATATGASIAAGAASAAGTASGEMVGVGVGGATEAYAESAGAATGVFAGASIVAAAGYSYSTSSAIMVGADAAAVTNQSATWGGRRRNRIAEDDEDLLEMVALLIPQLQRKHHGKSYH